MKTRPALLLFVLTGLFSFFVSTAFQHSEAATRRGTDVQIYSLQILVNQAYQMVLEGASLVMLDQMGKGGVFEGVIETRGWSMIDLGERIISDAVSGKEIQQLVSEGKGDDPLLSTVKENAVYIMEAVAGIRTYLKTNPTEPQLSQMHSLSTLLNHGMKMATDGANMIMLGRSGEPGGAKTTLQKHGRVMMRDGRVLIIRLSDNSTMKELHEAGYTIKQSPAMDALHNSIKQALRIIDRLARM
jgi:hypothetical protein